jgi:dTDP-4-amino-4,6-dideoxygalactose transaminase
MTTLGAQLVPFVDLGAQLTPIRDEVDAAMAAVLERGDYILGESVAAFEEEFAAYCGVRFGVGVDSGTSGLELALAACGIGPGDEVITVANTFIATVLAISHVGAVPVLVDVAPDTFTMDLDAVEAAIGPATKAIVPVHLYGYPAAMDRVTALAARHGLRVIEDASQAHGATYQGRRAGSFGDAAVFSLYPAKNLGALGDAGVVVTDDPAIDHELRLLRNYGSEVKYHHLSKGHNRRLDTLQAAVLRVKLPHLDHWNEARRIAAAHYDEALDGIDGVIVPPRPTLAEEPVYHLYPILAARRDELQEHLSRDGIATGIHYPVPIHLQPAYADLPYESGAFPRTEEQARALLSLPMYPGLTSRDVARVVESIRTFFGATGVNA